MCVCVFIYLWNKDIFWVKQERRWVFFEHRRIFSFFPLFYLEKMCEEILLLVFGEKARDRCLLCNSNLFGDIFPFWTGELGRSDCRPMARQEGDGYCVFDFGQRGPPAGQDFDGSQRMVRRLAGKPKPLIQSRHLLYGALTVAPYSTSSSSPSSSLSLSSPVSVECQ